MTNEPTEIWPSLPLQEWSRTSASLHMWTQIVGKIRLTQSPWVNHSWNCALYVTARGLSTSTIPYDSRVFQIDFDFITHQLRIDANDGRSAAIPLQPQSVAAFYRKLMSTLEELDLSVAIYPMPNEVADPIPFDRNEINAAYDPDLANRYWRILVQATRVFQEFRARFIGKCSPVHYFWGAPDLAVTRFSGRPAPEHPGGVPNLPDWVAREAYSHEVSSCGFWTGGGPVPYSAFYSYAYPEPSGFASAEIAPEPAFYSADLREFILPYEAVRQSKSPDETLLAFLQTTYDAAADLGDWNHPSLERDRDPRSAKKGPP